MIIPVLVMAAWQCNPRKLTNCLRVIRNAWHFYHALRFGV
ncbi:conserved hypothetical protein [Vibrio parahaemolyticus AQ3810]|nr:conserved hypothetical protein [Vibrio parahaemolyticus AQ3810]